MISESCNLNIYKTKGKVADLEAYVADKDQSGSIGIAHTRWGDTMANPVSPTPIPIILLPVDWHSFTMAL